MESKEDRMLVANVMDRLRQCADRYMITNSLFLDIRQRSIVYAALKKVKEQNYGFYGGFDEAERVIAVFLPDYIDDDPAGYFSDNPQDDPLVVLRVNLKKGAPALSHRDYLGVMMSLGIKREMTGDILVRKSGADIIVMGEVADFLIANMEKAGRTRLSIEKVTARELLVPEVRKKELIKSVASLRLDNVISAAFNISRGKAAEVIASGSVFVNGEAVAKVEKQVCQGDKLVLRGSGKAVLADTRGTSNKGRTIITIERYL